MKNSPAATRTTSPKSCCRRSACPRLSWLRILLADRRPEEARYYPNPGEPQVDSVYAAEKVDEPYGGFDIENMDSHGGWVSSEEFMLPNAVKLAVTASVPVECEFWTEDDGWKGACVELSVAVHGSNFEEAKQNMEAALQTAVESILRDRKMAA